jgi:hypothetical protein
MTMPIEIRYLDNGTGVLHIGTGRMTGKDILEAKLATFESGEKTRRYHYGLIDYAQVDDLEVSRYELEMVAARDKRAAILAPSVFVAIVAIEDFVFGLARMWQAFMGDAGWETHVFRSCGEAEA